MEMAVEMAAVEKVEAARAAAARAAATVLVAAMAEGNGGVGERVGVVSAAVRWRGPRWGWG